MALASLRCRLNAAFFLNGECQVGIRDLRPGAVLNKAAHMVEKSLAVFVGGEVPRTQMLYQHIETQAFKIPRYTGTAGNGVDVDLSIGDQLLVFKCAENQPAVDGMLTGPGILWLSQSKSTSIQAKTFPVLNRGEFTTISAAALRKLDDIHGVPENVKVVLDLFTTRDPSPELDYVAKESKYVKQNMVERINNTPIVTTTFENIEQCVGPVFALRIRNLKKEGTMKDVSSQENDQMELL